MKNSINQIRNFLSNNFEQSMQCGDIAANNTVLYDAKSREYRILTGYAQNDVTGTFSEVMERLHEIIEQDSVKM